MENTVREWDVKFHISNRDGLSKLFRPGRFKIVSSNIILKFDRVVLNLWFFKIKFCPFSMGELEEFCQKFFPHIN